MQLSKIDISNGFHRIGMCPTDAMRLAVLFPSQPGKEKLVGIPLTLPMGWAESPPAFCAVKEMVADLANWSLKGRRDVHTDRPHRLDPIAESPVPENLNASPLCKALTPTRLVPPIDQD